MITTDNKKSIFQIVFDNIDNNDFYSDVSEYYKNSILQGYYDNARYIKSDIFYNIETKKLTTQAEVGVTSRLLEGYHIKRFSKNKLFSKYISGYYWKNNDLSDLEYWEDFDLFIKQTVSKHLKKKVNISSEFDNSHYSSWDARRGYCLPSQLDDKELLSLVYRDKYIDFDVFLSEFKIEDKAEYIKNLLKNDFLEERSFASLFLDDIEILDELKNNLNDEQILFSLQTIQWVSKDRFNKTINHKETRKFLKSRFENTKNKDFSLFCISQLNFENNWEKILSYNDFFSNNDSDFESSFNFNNQNVFINNLVTYSSFSKIGIEIPSLGYLKKVTARIDCFGLKLYLTKKQESTLRFFKEFMNNCNLQNSEEIIELTSKLLENYVVIDSQLEFDFGIALIEKE